MDVINNDSCDLHLVRLGAIAVFFLCVCVRIERDVLLDDD